MQITDGEKLIIAMIADLAKALRVKGTEVDFAFVRAAIANGHAWALPEKYPGVFQTEGVSEEVTDETRRILNMWRHVETSYGELSKAEQERVTTEAHPADARFQGFDATNESHHGVAILLIQELGEFELFRGRDLNSQSPSVDAHRRMLAAYDQLLNDGGSPKRDFTAAEIITLLKARAAP